MWTAVPPVHSIFCQGESRFVRSLQAVQAMFEDVGEKCHGLLECLSDELYSARTTGSRKASKETYLKHKSQQDLQYTFFKTYKELGDLRRCRVLDASLRAINFEAGCEPECPCRVVTTVPSGSGNSSPGQERLGLSKGVASWSLLQWSLVWILDSMATWKPNKGRSHFDWTLTSGPIFETGHWECTHTNCYM
jgi:hypothetical protein